MVHALSFSRRPLLSLMMSGRSTLLGLPLSSNASPESGLAVDHHASETMDTSSNNIDDIDMSITSPIQSPINEENKRLLGCGLNMQSYNHTLHDSKQFILGTTKINVQKNMENGKDDIVNNACQRNVHLQNSTVSENSTDYRKLEVDITKTALNKMDCVDSVLTKTQVKTRPGKTDISGNHGNSSENMGMFYRRSTAPSGGRKPRGIVGNLVQKYEAKQDIVDNNKKKTLHDRNDPIFV